MSSGNGQHLSASQRKILALEQQVSQLEAMRAEFILLINYLVRKDGSYRLYRNDLLAMGPPRTVKAVRASDPVQGDFIEWTLVDPPAEPEKRIIVPGQG